MEKTKLSIIYYSATGTNYQMAIWAQEAAQATGAKVRLRKVRELAPAAAIDANPDWRRHVEATRDVTIAESDDLVWADALLLSAPSRFGVMPAQMKQFLDMQGGLWAQGKLMDKAVSAMSSAQNPHGGQEMTVQSLYIPMMHWGSILVPPGYSDDSAYQAGGNPYGTTVTQDEDGTSLKDAESAVQHQVRRLLKVAFSLKKGDSNH